MLTFKMLIKWSYYEEEEFFAEDFILFLIWASDSLILTEFKICESSLLSSHITSSVVVCHSGCDTNTGYCLAVVSGGCCLCWVKAVARCCSTNLLGIVLIAGSFPLDACLSANTC